MVYIIIYKMDSMWNSTWEAILLPPNLWVVLVSIRILQEVAGHGGCPTPSSKLAKFQ